MHIKFSFLKMKKKTILIFIGSTQYTCVRLKHFFLNVTFRSLILLFTFIFFLN